ncbi:ApeI family dehydratase [Marinomonas transparens]|uniref:Acyl-CoA synthetase n=1 Tax=Marinomonas transparens TaxID=2795388 RepID=A0A934JUQ9_9GAMM|nr:AMP-binding protein [Marinomonas transparens]MBJ7538701.1 acyl-CoA synthetase [Marinomonas transparens]
MKKLSTWLSDTNDKPIAILAGQVISKRQFCTKVAAWQTRLPLVPKQKWAVYHNDAIEFLAILFALWHSKCMACIPSDNCEATVTRLSANVAGFIGEFSLVGDQASVWQLADGFDENSLAQPLWNTLEKSFPALEVYTSGSTGEPKPIIRTLEQIDHELASLELLWPLSASAMVLSTVTHQHLFGLTFRLFWPLVKGQIFQAKHCPFTEDIYHLATQCERFILISTPAHLKRLNDQLDWLGLAGKCEATISSAAPLKYEDSLYAAQLLNAPIFEIYGSSETGALAWRNQSKKDQDYWTLLPNVKLEATSTSGRFLAIGAHIAPEYQALSDNIEQIAEDRFYLRGRTDRIVKVEGKRLSLAKLEKCLEESEWVHTAKALVVVRKREEVAVVIELSNLGLSLLKQRSEKWLATQLKTQLKASFEPVLLPRRWRFVKALPYNQQGKLPMESLQTLFQPVQPKWPTELDRKHSNNHCEFTFHIPAELVYFEGHFDGNPILPGIAQTHWAQHYGRKVFAFSGKFVRLEAIKFQQIIFPDSEVTLKLEFLPKKNRLAFQYLSSKGVHSSGRICFE